MAYADTSDGACFAGGDQGASSRLKRNKPRAEQYGPSLGWGRLIYRKGEDELGQGASYDYRIQAFQVGTDLYRHEDVDGSTDQAGLSLNVGRIAGDVEHTNGNSAGDDVIRAYGVGGYWTHFGPEGWYLDGVLQFNRFDVQAKPSDMDTMKTRGRGVTASLEGGYPFNLNEDKNLHIEPQAQVIVSKIKVDDSHDDASDVRFEDVDSLTARLGVRIDKDSLRADDQGKLHRTNVWVRPSVWHEFKGKSKTEFSSADGYIPFGTDMSGTWGELNLGVDYQVDERTTVTGSLGYQKAFGKDSTSYEGMIGIKVKF